MAEWVGAGTADAVATGLTDIEGICNIAMHIGMADLSVLRFAKKSWYGVASAAGMYVGHFMAWISAQRSSSHGDDRKRTQ